MYSPAKLGGQTPIHVNWIELLDGSVFRILHSVSMYSPQYSPSASVFMTTSCREEYRKPQDIITHYCSTLVLGNTLPSSQSHHFLSVCFFLHPRFPHKTDFKQMIMIWIVYYITPPSSVDTRWPPWTLFHGGFKLKVLSTPQPPTAASSKRSSILVVVSAPPTSHCCQ